MFQRARKKSIISFQEDAVRHILVERRGKKLFLLQHRSMVLPPIFSKSEKRQQEKILHRILKEMFQKTSNISLPRKITVMLPQALFKVFIPKTHPFPKNPSRKKIRKFLEEQFSQQRKFLSLYGFEYSFEKRKGGAPRLRFRFLLQETHRWYEKILKKFSLHIEAFQPSLHILSEYIFRETQEGNFLHLHIGETSSFLFQNKNGEIFMEKKFAFSYQGIRSFIEKNEKRKEIFLQEGFYETEENTRLLQELQKYFHPLAQYLMESSLSLPFYVTSSQRIPKGLLAKIQRVYAGEVYPFCVFDSLQKKMDGVLQLHKEEDKMFSPLLAEASMALIDDER